ncbi:MAG: hypothetical protein L3J83_05200, partial [Proteobacteria bacterium]|nr:hypothetical protein [Pseudomonadota bacterium]
MKYRIKKTKNKTKNKTKYSLRKNILASAISLCLPYSLQAANFDVTVSTDNGTGLIKNTLSWAILQANTEDGDDTITLSTDVIITGVMKRLIDSNVLIQSNDINARNSISGNNQFRPFFIKSGQVTIQHIDIKNSIGVGGNSDTGSPGAGMGGAIFIYDGNVNISHVAIVNSIAVGGLDLADNSNTSGGGGM